MYNPELGSVVLQLSKHIIGSLEALGELLKQVDAGDREQVHELCNSIKCADAILSSLKEKLTEEYRKVVSIH